MALLNSRASGQALIEWALLLMLFTLLFAGLFAFTQWFLIRQNLLMAAKEGAWLYSSGRLQAQEVHQILRGSLGRSVPSLNPEDVHMYIGPAKDSQASFYQLDQVLVRYQPTTLMRRFFRGPLEESCVIKHAPQYGYPGSPASFGPPVPWDRRGRTFGGS